MENIPNLPVRVLPLSPLTVFALCKSKFHVFPRYIHNCTHAMPGTGDAIIKKPTEEISYVSTEIHFW